MSNSNITEYNYINIFSVKLNSSKTTVTVGQTITTNTFTGMTPVADVKEQLEFFGESLTMKSYITGVDILKIVSNVPTN